MSESGTLGWVHHPGRMSQPFVTWQGERVLVFCLGVPKHVLAFQHTRYPCNSCSCRLLAAVQPVCEPVATPPPPLFLGGSQTLLPVPDNRSFMSWVNSYIWLMQTPAFSAGRGRPHQCQRKVDCKYWQEDSTRRPATLSESDWSGVGVGGERVDWDGLASGDGGRRRERSCLLLRQLSVLWCTVAGNTLSPQRAPGSADTHTWTLHITTAQLFKMSKRTLTLLRARWLSTAPRRRVSDCRVNPHPAAGIGGWSEMSNDKTQHK